MKKKILYITLILLFLDQLSKILINKFLILGKSYQICDKLFYVTKMYNDGISFSLLQGYRYVIILISILVMIFLYFYMKKFKNNTKNIIAFSLVFSGLLGNLIDRIVYGYVIDFLDFYVFNYNFPIFNLADSFIFIGVVLIIYSIYNGEDNETNSKRK